MDEVEEFPGSAPIFWKAPRMTVKIVRDSAPYDYRAALLLERSGKFPHGTAAGLKWFSPYCFPVVPA
jgi:hypothetical protein